MCFKNPTILPTEIFNGFDCITLLNAFTNVYLNKDVLKGKIWAWRNFSGKNFDLSIINYRFTAYEHYVWWS